MTPPAPSGVARPEIATESFGDTRPGWIANATSGDHKVVGRMYIAASLAFAAFALTELVLMRIQLMVPDFTFLRPEIFDRLLSTYGVTALILFAIPLLLGLMMYVVPLQIGARGTALPRVGMLSFWLYLLGGVSIYASFLYRPSEAGTTAIPPLSDNAFLSGQGVDAWILGVGLASLGFVLFAVNMLATLRGLRAPGMVPRRMPLFSSAASVVSYVLLFIGPVMLATLTMLFIDRNFDGVFFETGEGGAPILYQHLSWIFFTGAYVTVIIGAFGAISEILATFSRQPVFGHRTIAGSLAAFAFFGIAAWMQNMYSAPIPVGFLYFTMAMALAALVPVGLILFNWIATLSGGAARMKPPMRFAIAAIAITTIGLAGEFAQSVIPVAWQVAETGVAWGDTHFALIGAGVLGGFAALYYWFPKITGRLMGESLGRASLATIVVGTLLMVIPIQLAGLQGMPVDVYKFFGDTGMSAYNLLGSLGSFVFAIGVILTLVNAAASYDGGTEAGHDPWGGTSLEWFALSPPPPHNFDLVPDVRSNEPLRDIREAIGRRATEVSLPVARPAGTTAPEPESAAAEATATGAESSSAEDVAMANETTGTGASDGDGDSDGSVA